MILLHASAFASFRDEIIHALGLNRARRLLTRLGYAMGSSDAQLALRVRPKDRNNLDALLVGTRLCALEGTVRVEPVEVRINIEKGEYYGEFLWHGSIEGETHLQQFGPVPYPTCWMILGYACGYTAGYIGRPILYRELECCASGAEHCRIIGKPLDEWEDSSADLRYLSFGEIRLSGKPKRAVAKRGSLQGRAQMPHAEEIIYSGDSGAPDAIVGVSSHFIAALHKLRKVAPTNATVLLSGESGVGKECFARLLHHLSARRDGPFIALNCAAVPPELFEAELFGVRKGAYTGAVESRPGRFERANAGTLFLDEVDTLPVSCQAKLLRTLEEGKVERLGDFERRPLDVRIVAATNADLRAETRERRFRAALFYRLNVFPITILPLRSRRDDVPILLDHFLRRYSAEHRKRVTGLTEAAMDLLLAYDYPGNVRELQKMIERAVILVDDGMPIERHHLVEGNTALKDLAIKIAQGGTLSDPPSDDHGNDWTSPPALADLESFMKALLEQGVGMRELEDTYVKAAVKIAGGNLSKAARQAGLTRAQVAYRVEKQNHL